MYAIWYLFERKDEEKIKKNIVNISQEYNAPAFIPHITAYGLVNMDLKILTDIVSRSIKNIEPFSVEKKSISFSNNFWKTLFIDFENNSSMLKINKKLTENLSKFSKYEFKPHSSLIYKNLNLKENQKIIENIKLEKFFKIDSIGILKFSDSITKWKIIEKKLLIKVV